MPLRARYAFKAASSGGNGTFTQFLPRTPERSFIAGETHPYLGRQYRLKVVVNLQERVKRIRG